MQESKCAELYEKYRIETEIGRGASGICFRVENIKTKEVLAMKKIHVTSIKKNSTRQACSEVQILSKINHCHIIKLHQFFSDENYVYIIMQYASKGDLHQILKRRKIKREIYSQPQIWEMARQLLTALEYLHNRNIIHRDVKTLNIFMDANSRIYLGDLGVSKILKADSGLYSRVGTPLYLAPEIIKNEKYDFKADIWGSGCVCYQLATLAHPFQGKNIINLGQNIVGAQPKNIDNYSSSLNSLIMEMLEKNPRKRPSASDLLKKYFQNKPIPSTITTSLEIKPQKIEAKGNIFGFESVNKISGGRQLLEVRSNHMKRQIMNNYLEERLSFKAKDCIKQDELKKKAVELDELDQTIILAKKSDMEEETKKYVQATRKNYPQRQTQPVRYAKKHDKQLKGHCRPLQDERSAKQTFISFSSEKKILPQTPIGQMQNLKNTPFPLYQRETKKCQNIEVGFGDVSRLPSQAALLTSKARIRPKSSIMTKERHQSTMKNIRKNFKKEIDDLDHDIETHFLKRPQVIIL